MTAQKPDPTGAKILDGAIRVLGDFGFKRATVELVAKYAGVSHMTIYRRWPSKVDLLKTAIVGESRDCSTPHSSRPPGMAPRSPTGPCMPSPTSSGQFKAILLPPASSIPSPANPRR